MFNFIKKSTVLAGGDPAGCEERDGDKERRKREKKERKEREKRERLAAGLEEPLRLEEVRRSLKLRGRRKEKEKLPSGITADYTASLFAHLEQDSNYSNYPLIPTSGSNSNLSDENNHTSPGYPATHTWKKEGVLQSDSSETSLNSLNNPNSNTSPRQPPNLPPIPPRPPKRGILKGPRLSNTSSNSQESNVQSSDVIDHVNGQDSNLLARNTQQNELISYGGIPPSKSTSSSDDMQHVQNFTKKVIHSPVDQQFKNYKNNSSNPSITTQDMDEIPKTNGNGYLGVTSTSPSADSLTDTTTNSSFATPPFSTSPVGESQGFHRWSRTSNFDDIDLPLPGLTPLHLPKPRILTIQRQKAPRNDFGFSLRRAVVQERVFIGEINGHGLLNGDNKCSDVRSLDSKLTYKSVILAEPGSYPGASETGLLPGDRLIEVNGVNVEEKSREEVIELIKGSQDYVTIKVQPIAELCELSRRRAADGGGDVELADGNVRGGTLSRSGSRRFNATQARSEEQLACEKEWLQAGHMWLAHRGGFTAVVREGEADSGRAKVRVLQTGEVITVDEDDLEKANPPQLERCEDIASLRCLNECGALNVLRSRYAAGLPHARAGHALLVLGPPKRTAPIYTEKVAAMFRGCRTDDMPPHVYAAAQSAHRCMLASRRDRAIVFLGRSGSGKTSAMRHSIWYLASAYPAQGSKLTPERLDAAFDVLHAFGSSRTSSNTYASRFVSLASLDFDGGGALVSASVQTLLPDLRPTQSLLRALHTLFHGCDGRLRRELLFDQSPVNSPNPCISTNEKSDAPAEFSALKEALQLLNVTEQEQMAIWKISAAVCHLGWAGAVKANTGSGIKYQFASTGCGQRAAKMLGVTPEELIRAVFATVPTSPQQNSTLRTPSPSNERELSGTEALDAFVSGLYNEAFNMIAALVNRSLSSSARTLASILLLDTPGADNPMCAGQQSGAPLSKLLSNYLQERLQAVFHEAMLVAPRERYAQEGITLDDGAEDDWLSETVNPGPMVELLDKSPQNTIVRSSQADLRECDRRGLLWLLDEESMYPGSGDDTFLERVMSHYGSPNHTQYLIKKAPHARQFVLQHLQGTNPVLYDVTGWVKASRENPVTKKSLTLLQESQNEEIGRLSSWARGACGISAWSAAVGDASTLRRASSIRRTLTSGTAGMKRRSTALQAKFVADGVVDTLRRCGSGGVQFVCCLLTNQPSDSGDDVNVPLLRSQFRGFQLLDAARLYKQGFPEHMPLSEFARRYRLLATSESEDPETPQPTNLSDRQIVDDMLLTLDLDVTSYRLGLTQEALDAMNARFLNAAVACGSPQADIGAVRRALSSARAAADRSLRLRPFTADEVYHTVTTRIPPKQSKDVYGLSMEMLRTAIIPLAPLLSSLFNTCLKEGSYPGRLKVSKISPIFKGKGKRENMDGYRPVSIIPAIAKIFENGLSSRLIEYLSSTSALSDRQYAYRAGRSTTSLTREVVRRVVAARERKQQVAVLCCDLSKAFDVADHAVLAVKLKHYGIHGKSYELLTNLLRGRSQIVDAGDGRSKSDPLSSSMGVAQGSSVSNILFSLLLNDLPDVVTVADVLLYADDVAAIVTDATVDRLEERLNEVASTLAIWFHSNGLALNLGKTHFIHFNLSGRVARPLAVKVDGAMIDQVENTTFLGFEIDKGLTWECHVHKLCGKLGSACYALSRVSRVAPAEVSRACYFATVHSLLQYGAELWARCAQWERVFRMQKRAVRAIMRIPRDTSARPYFKELGILTLPAILILQVAVYVRDNLALYKKNSDNHSYSTRNSNKLAAVSRSLAKSSKLTHILGPAVYNKLPDDIVAAPSMACFKSRLKRWLIVQTFYRFEEFMTL